MVTPRIIPQTRPLALWILVCNLVLSPSQPSQAFDYSFFDRELRPQAPKIGHFLYVELSQAPNEHLSSDSVLSLLSFNRRATAQPWEEGFLIQWFPPLTETEIAEIANQLRAHPKVRFVSPSFVADKEERITKPEVRFELDPRLSSSEAEEICREIGKELGVSPPSPLGTTESSHLRVIRGVQDPWALARRLALSRTKGVLWAEPGWRLLKPKFEYRAVLYLPETGESAQAVTTLLGDPLVLRVEIGHSPSVDWHPEELVTALQRLAPQDAEGHELTSTLFFKGPIEESRAAEVWNAQCEVKIYRVGEWTFSLPLLKYRDRESGVEETIQGPSLRVVIPSLASTKEELNPLKPAPPLEVSAGNTTSWTHSSPVFAPKRLLGIGITFFVAGLLLLLSGPAKTVLPKKTPAAASPSIPQVADSIDWLATKLQKPHKDLHDAVQIRAFAWKLLQHEDQANQNEKILSFAKKLLEKTEPIFTPTPQLDWNEMESLMAQLATEFGSQEPGQSKKPAKKP